MLRLLPLAALLLAVSACDSYTDDPYDDHTPRALVRVVDFEFDRDGYQLSTDGTTASFESDDITSNAVRDRLVQALRVAGDGAIVIAYVDSRFLIDATTTGQTWSALPATRAFRDEIPYDVDNDGVADEFVPVETVLSYEYSFDNEDFYFDVVSSAPASDFAPGALFSYAIDTNPRLRVVTLPADIVNKTSVDLTDYEAVRTAFGLPE